MNFGGLAMRTQKQVRTWDWRIGKHTNNSHRVRPELTRSRPMTVCIGAICNQRQTIVCACDRMITSGDIEFEPTHPKLALTAPNRVVMYCGDAGIHMQAHYDATPNGLEANAQLSVREFAERYRDAMHGIYSRIAESSILSKYGLTYASFLERQAELSEGFIEAVREELSHYYRGCSDDIAIVAGWDSSGMHLYQVGRSGVYCEDRIGFVAIGSGGFHADSQFMFEKHSPESALSATVLLVYTAKKHAEVAPGVGTATDMYLIDLEKTLQIEREGLDRIDTIYKRTRDQVAAAKSAGNKEMDEYLHSVFVSKQPEKAGPA